MGFGAAMWGSEPLMWGLEVSFANNGVRRSEMWGSWPPSLPTLVSGISKTRAVLKVSSLELSSGLTLLLLLLFTDFDPHSVPSSTSDDVSRPSYPTTSGDVSRPSYPTTSGDVSKPSFSTTSGDVSRSGYVQYCTPPTLDSYRVHGPRSTYRYT